MFHTPVHAKENILLSDLIALSKTYAESGMDLHNKKTRIKDLIGGLQEQSKNKFDELWQNPKNERLPKVADNHFALKDLAELSTTQTEGMDLYNKKTRITNFLKELEEQVDQDDKFNTFWQNKTPAAITELNPSEGPRF